MSLIDAEQRRQATNPQLSFLVQAPAGSGKTEILTQRFLRLLGTVTAPEQIIALTFTRKAASEMCERIVLALKAAATNQPAQNPHQQITLDLAKEALHRDQQYQWDLLQQPNRLKVITIDSLCQSINQAIPLLEQQIVYPKITEKPGTHYLNAAKDCIQSAIDTPHYQPAIKSLLLHVDNQQEHLQELFTTLLSQRDQWLSPLFQAQAQEKFVFEQALQFIEQQELTRLKRSLPPLVASELTSLVRELALIENDPNSLRYDLKDWDHFDQINQTIAESLRKTLLTDEHHWRKSFDHHVGLKKEYLREVDYSRLKKASKALLEQLSFYPDFLHALLQVSLLPKPEYDPKQWEVLQALFVLLPLLVAHLHLVFSEHNEVDFTAISQQALTALGDSENPTDLALYLDHTIHHLLVDEFQDTSIAQFELLSQLVQGWQAHEGKTLFLVGDPMQSIYRFRQAEVGLFFHAKEQGIGPVRFQFLELRCNFRSTKTIIHWVNQHFAPLFPQQVDNELGAVCFHPSTHVLEDKGDSAVHALQFKSKEEEAQHLISLIQSELHKQPDQTLAVLVRSRSHLLEITKLLREHQIAYQGTDIDLLANWAHIRDAWSLTQALLLPGNRLAWLTMLRSPYCGLSLTDILSIAQFDKNKSIYQALLQLDRIEELSEEGRIRTKFFIQVMHLALSQRAQKPLSDWVNETLRALHAEKILDHTQLSDLDQLWVLLDRYEQDNRIPQLQEFLREFHSLYSQQTKPSRLHIMTIHKSKGLEFDTVFLPGLGSQPKSHHHPMLRWLKIPTQDHGNLLLVSPIQARHRTHCPLYHYISQIDEKKSYYETQRLLYVAVTRAKSRLYLMNGSSQTAKKSFHNLLKQQQFTAMESTQTLEQRSLSLPKLIRLPLHFYLNPSEPLLPPLNPASTLNLSQGLSKAIGTITHRLLQWICEHHPPKVHQVPWHLAHQECISLGFDENLQQRARLTIQDQIGRMFEDQIGAWILAKHFKERNEYELLIEQENQVVTRIIDRSFEEKGILWVIDFKTGKEKSTTAKQHRQQVHEYAQALSTLSTLPIHCGIYYLNNQHWVHWPYSLIPTPCLSYDKSL